MTDFGEKSLPTRHQLTLERSNGGTGLGRPETLERLDVPTLQRWNC